MGAHNAKIVGCVYSDVGLIRKNNEDNFLLGHCLNEYSSSKSEAFLQHQSDEWVCAAVFDGMGGAEGGEVASHVAANTFQERTWNMEQLSDNQMIAAMEKTYKIANDAIVREREKHSACGTTGTAIVANKSKFRVFHKGDSRAYFMHQNSLYLLSVDQTLAELKLQLGIYHSRQEVPEKEYHQLTEFIGMDDIDKESIPFQTDWIEWQKGDRILLCSDGLYDMCGEECILKVLSEQDETKAGKLLMEEALMNGGRDNVTVLILTLI